MRKTLAISGLIIVLLVAYMAWPFVDLYRLGRALEHRDIAAVADRVEMRAIRPDLSRQVLATYLRLTGHEARLPGSFRDMAIGMGAAMIDPLLEEVISLERMVDLFDRNLAPGIPAQGQQSTGGGERAPLFPSGLGSAWDLFANADYKLTNVYVSVPPGVKPAQRFTLRLHLVQWKWKLYGLELPEAVRVSLAEELIRRSANR
jgi:hypothetical protein